MGRGGSTVLGIGVFIALCGVLLVAGAAVGGGLPTPITPDSPCPATGCANGACHGFDAVPEPDGASEMDCPETTCSSADCHAWEVLGGRYRKASDGSLNLWVLAPAVAVVAFMTLVRRTR